MGSCGFGALGSSAYPYGAIASILNTSAVLAGLPSSGCGACIQLTCMNQASALLQAGLRLVHALSHVMLHRASCSCILWA